MRNLVTRMSILISIFAFSISLVLTDSAEGFDPTPPSLGAVTVTPLALPESGGKVVLTLQATAATYGLDQLPLPTFGIQGYSKNFSCSGFPNGLRMSLISGTEKSGTYQCEINFAAPLMPGIYKLTIFPLTDKAGNTTSFIFPSISVAVGVPVVATTPPTPTTTLKPDADSPSAGSINSLVELRNQVSRLQLQITSLNAKLKRICSVKPKPRGC